MTLYQYERRIAAILAAAERLNNDQVEDFNINGKIFYK